MGNELRIIIEGIVVLAPGPPLNAPDHAPGPLYGVMPRLTRHESRYSKLGGIGPLYIPAHLPAVFTTLKTVGDSRHPDETRDDFSIWYPIRERMELNFGADPDPSDLRWVRADTPLPPVPDPDPLMDIAYIADFRETWPDRGKLGRGMLEKSPPVSELVACQLLVPSGWVGSHGEFKKQEPADATSLPSRTPIPVRKKLLPQVVVSVRTDRVDFRMYSLDTGEELDSLAFLVEDSSKPSVIRIANGDPKNIHYVIEHLINPANATEPTGIKPSGDGSFGDIDFEADTAFSTAMTTAGISQFPGSPSRSESVQLQHRFCGSSLEPEESRARKFGPRSPVERALVDPVEALGGELELRRFLQVETGPELPAVYDPLQGEVPGLGLGVREGGLPLRIITLAQRHHVAAEAEDVAHAGIAHELDGHRA